MISPIIQQQFEALRDAHRRETGLEPRLEPLVDGSVKVTVPGVPLGHGWSKPSTMIAFVLPAGYPMSRPDCFWADRDLALSNGSAPANTGQNAMYGLDSLLWFSYHPQTWNPNQDNLSTYYRVIRRRLADPR